MTELTKLRELAEKLQRENDELRAALARNGGATAPEGPGLPSPCFEVTAAGRAALDELARHSQASGEYDPPADAA